MTEPERQRIDKWLWHARFARTRGAAQELARSGHVRVNRDKVHDASRPVRAGDVLTLNLSRGIRVIRVLGISERRDAYEQAKLLYEEVAQNAAGVVARSGQAEPGFDER
jgi:ribosome-associated heat shock protein Hsp15